MRKKDGSALILVLMITMILTILAGTITTSIVNTSRSNGIKKVDDDLFYAAESGIEFGEAKLNENTIKYIMDNGTYRIEDIKYENNTVEKIEMLFRKVNDKKIELTSKSIGYNGKSKAIKTYYSIENNSKPPVGGAINILENGLIANEIRVGASNCTVVDDEHIFDMRSSQVTGNTIGFPPCSGLPVVNDNIKVEEARFYEKDTPNTDGGYINKVKEINVNYISMSPGASGKLLTALCKPQENILNRNGTSKVENGVARIQNTYLQFESDSLYYDVIFVNAEKLVINPIGIVGITDARRIIICSGDIIINTLEIPSLLDHSTLYGKSITINTPSSMKQSFAPLFGQEGHMLKDNQVREINYIASKYIKNWNSAITEPGEGDGTASGQWTKLEDETIYE